MSAYATTRAILMLLVFVLALLLPRLSVSSTDSRLSPNMRPSVWIIIRTFIAFFFVLFGVAVISGADEARALVGAALAALGLTFLGRLWLTIRTGV